MFLFFSDSLQMPKKSAKGARRNQNNNVIAQNNNSPTEPGQMVASKLAETENSKSGIPGIYCPRC